MNNKAYSALLTERKWKRKREQILRRDGWKCTACGKKTTLQVHHTYYIDGHKPWEYPNDSLLTVCRDCHKDYHEHHEIEVRTARGKKKIVRHKPSPEKARKKRERKERRANKHVTSVTIQKARGEQYRKKVNGEWVVFTKPPQGYLESK